MTWHELTVAHESGHLAAAVVLDLEPTRAEITPGNRHQSGAVHWRLGDVTPELAIRIAKMTLSGRQWAPANYQAGRTPDRVEGREPGGRHHQLPRV